MFYKTILGEWSLQKSLIRQILVLGGSFLFFCPLLLAQEDVQNDIENNYQALSQVWQEHPEQVYGSILFIALIIVICTFLLRFLQRFLCKGLSFRAGNWDVSDVMVGICFYFGFILLSAVLAESLASGEDQKYVLSLIVHLLSQTVACSFIYFFLTSFRGQSLRVLGLSKTGLSLQRVFLVIASYLVFVPIFLAAYWLSLANFVIWKITPASQPIAEQILNSQGAVFYLGVFMAVVGAPILEEFLFRMFLYTGFRKHLGPKAAIFVTSFVFALVHFNALGFFPIFVLGAFFNILYEKTQRLWIPILAHACHNGLTLFCLIYFVAK